MMWGVSCEFEGNVVEGRARRWRRGRVEVNFAELRARALAIVGSVVECGSG